MTWEDSSELARSGSIFSSIGSQSLTPIPILDSIEAAPFSERINPFLFSLDEFIEHLKNVFPIIIDVKQIMKSRQLLKARDAFMKWNRDHCKGSCRPRTFHGQKPSADPSRSCFSH